MKLKKNLKITVAILLMFLSISMILIGIIGAIAFDISITEDNAKGQDKMALIYVELLAQSNNIFFITFGIVFLLISFLILINILPDKKEAEMDNSLYEKSIISSIQTLHSLYEKGILTEEEFKERKALLLSNNK